MKYNSPIDKKKSHCPNIARTDPDDSCFLVARIVSNFALVIAQTKTKIAMEEGYLSIPMFSEGLLIGKQFFRTGLCLKKTAFFKAHFQQVPNFQLNILRYLALQSEALVILLGEPLH